MVGTVAPMTEWKYVCGLCHLDGTDRCLHCPTRRRAVPRAFGQWFGRHRLTIIHVSVFAAAVVSVQLRTFS